MFKEASPLTHPLKIEPYSDALAFILPIHRYLAVVVTIATVHHVWVPS